MPVCQPPYNSTMTLLSVLRVQNFTFIEHQLSAYSGTQGAVSGLRWSQQVKIKPSGMMIEPLCVQLPRHSGSIAV